MPLVVRDPRLPAAQRGVTRDQLVLNIDVAPTLIAAAGLPVPAVMQGQDLSPLYLRRERRRGATNSSTSTRPSRARTAFRRPRRSLRKDWKDIEWPEFDYPQLFDLKHDPGELRNLAHDRAHATQAEKMRQQLDAWRQRAR